MHITHEVLIDCSNMTGAECSDACLAALGHGIGFKLKCDTATDTVHGSVSIVHADLPNPHIITIECYEVDEAPTAKMKNGMKSGRESTLACCAVMPTEKSLKDKLDKLKKAGV